MASICSSPLSRPTHFPKAIRLKSFPYEIRSILSQLHKVLLELLLVRILLLILILIQFLKRFLNYLVSLSDALRICPLNTLLNLYKAPHIASYYLLCMCLGSLSKKSLGSVRKGAEESNSNFVFQTVSVCRCPSTLLWQASWFRFG